MTALMTSNCEATGADRLRLARSLIWEAFDGGPPHDIRELQRLERHYLAIVGRADSLFEILERLSERSPDLRAYFARGTGGIDVAGIIEKLHGART